MNKTIELSTGKIVDLSRFVALIPNDEAAENHQDRDSAFAPSSPSGTGEAKPLVSQTDETSVGSPHQYSLILEGYAQSINLNLEEANSVKKHLRVDTQKKHNGTWDREEQLRLNQPKMKKLKEIIERKKLEQPSAEKAEFFEDFKRTMDAERPEGRKLYEH